MLYDNNNNHTNGWQQPMDYWNNRRLPQYDIIRVNGENGANAFQMGPNSKILLLDENAPIVWLVQTDGAGYKTVEPYDVTPHKTAPPIDLNSLEARIVALEERINDKSDTRSNRQKSKRSATNASTADADTVE